MELIQHTITWTKGEIFESVAMAIVGALILLSSALFWKFGTTPYAKAMVVPMLVVGLIPVVFGICGAIGNKNRIAVYEDAWRLDRHQFVLDEKARVEGFDEIFKYSYPFAIAMTIGGAILFFTVSSPNWKAICLAMMSLGLMAYFVDHFAAERADIYLEEIKKAL